MTELKWKNSALHYGKPIEYSAEMNGIKAQIKRRADEGWSVTVNGVVCASGADVKSAMIVAEKEIQRLMNYTAPERFTWNDTFDESFGKVSKSEIVIDGQIATILIQSDGSYKVYFNASCIGGANDLESARDIALSKFNEITMPSPVEEPAMKALKSASVDNQALKDAGNAMAAAAFRVATEYDGCHRLMLAVAAWATAVANEGGRGNG